MALVRSYVTGWVTNANRVNRTRWLSVDEAEKAQTLRR
jgi:hypothetical protein